MSCHLGTNVRRFSHAEEMADFNIRKLLIPVHHRVDEDFGAGASRVNVDVITRLNNGHGLGCRHKLPFEFLLD
jgi:hypothetical protein